MSRSSNTPVAVPAALPKPDGDPEAMRRMAADCRDAVTDLRAGVTATTSALSGMALHSRAARQLTGVTEGNAGAANRSADALETLAADLERGIHSLEKQWSDYRRREQAIEDAKLHNTAIKEFPHGSVKVGR